MYKLSHMNVSHHFFEICAQINYGPQTHHFAHAEEIESGRHVVSMSPNNDNTAQMNRLPDQCDNSSSRLTNISSERMTVINRTELNVNKLMLSAEITEIRNGMTKWSD